MTIWQRIWTKLPLLLLISLFSVASFKAYVKIQTTLIGYRIGQNKKIEAEILKHQSYLKMELARVTTKQSLVQLSTKEPKKVATQTWASY